MTIDLTPLDLGDKYATEEGVVFMTGVQALVRLPLEQHRADARRGTRSASFISGYQGSPLGTYDLELARHRSLLAEHHVTFQMGVNEELGATAVMGSQVAHTLPDPLYDGVVGYWYGKGPGFDRAADAIRHANFAGTAPRGGVLALVGDDPTAKSSTIPCDTVATIASLNMPILYPGDVQEVLDLGLHGVALSRCSGLWVGFKMATNVADGWGTVNVGPDRIQPVMVDRDSTDPAYAHEPTLHFAVNAPSLEHSMLYERREAALTYARLNHLNRITVRGEADQLGIVAPGKTYYDLRQALRDLGLEDDDLARLGIRLLHVRMLYPLDGEIVRDFVSGLGEILILEEKQPFLERLIKDELFNVVDRPVVLGKQDEEGRPLVKRDGELEPDSISMIVAERVLRIEQIASVRDRLARLRTLAAPVPLATARSPYYCSGCPHNTSTANLPDNALVGAGIGCHSMVAFMREEDTGTITGFTQMGGEGVQWAGQAPFTATKHIFQNLGDGTFHHSGSLAIRASVAAGTNITYKLLWNSHVAMTGGQPPIPGLTLENVTHWLKAEGVKRVIVTTEDTDRWIGADIAAGVEVWDRERIIDAQETLAAIQGTTVLIHDQECAAEKRRKRKRGKLDDPPMRVFINERVCEGCGDCGEKSNCVSVQPVDTEFGRKTQIHQPSCNKDYTCLKGDCPSFLTIIPGEKKSGGPRLEPLADDVFKAPASVIDVDGDFGMRITGIGGTGVVTVAQTLATAAALDGHRVRGLDQTGLAQKGGPVVSDLRFTARDVDQANKLASADCHLYLAADLLVGATSKNLVAADPARTVSVVSTARVPTGAMVVDTLATYPDPSGLVERILKRSRRDASVQIDAQGVAERLFGTDIVANMLLVGAAYQAGALPMSAESLEQAIETNGAAVKLNIQAFRRGRQAVADPEGLQRAVEESSPPAPGPRALTSAERALVRQVGAPSGSELDRLLRIRVPELTAYQSLAYAKRYVRDVERVRARESAVCPGETGLTEAVAFYLHKLMAYKDEYEVARLSLDPRLRRDIEASFGEGATFEWRLHPPVLRALGMERKIALGEWFESAYKALARMKHLRGTRLDPFGRAEVRQVERQLIVEYRQLIDELLTKLNQHNHAIAVEIARLPDLIRGYENVKLAGVKTYRQRLAVLRPQLDAPAVPATIAVTHA